MCVCEPWKNSSKVEEGFQEEESEKRLTSMKKRTITDNENVVNQRCKTGRKSYMNGKLGGFTLTQQRMLEKIRYEIYLTDIINENVSNRRQQIEKPKYYL